MQITSQWVGPGLARLTMIVDLSRVNMQLSDLAELVEGAVRDRLGAAAPPPPLSPDCSTCRGTGLAACRDCQGSGKR